jgi:hypothetical protein
MMKHKTITVVSRDNGSVHFHYATVYSVDGHTWASNRRHLGQYYRRMLAELEECQEQFDRIDTSTEYQIHY